jgi:hypothetical protein
VSLRTLTPRLSIHPDKNVRAGISPLPTWTQWKRRSHMNLRRRAYGEQIYKPSRRALVLESLGEKLAASFAYFLCYNHRRPLFHATAISARAHTIMRPAPPRRHMIAFFDDRRARCSVCPASCRDEVLKKGARSGPGRLLSCWPDFRLGHWIPLPCRPASFVPNIPRPLMVPPSSRFQIWT